MLDYIQHLLLEIIPVFFLAVISASIIDYFLPDDFFKKKLNYKFELLNIFIAALLGSLVPICTCGMIPLAIKLNDKGLNWKYLVAFLTAGNANSIPAMIISSTLGFEFIVYRLIFSVLFGVLTSIFISCFVAKDFKIKIKFENEHDHCCGKNAFLEKVLLDIKDMAKNFLPWILIAIYFAAVMHDYFSVKANANFIVNYLHNDFISPFALSVIGFPFYFCAGADVPLAKEFLALALPFGSVLTFMLAAPGINLTSLLVYKKAVGLKSAFVYTLVSIVVISSLGVIINLIL